MPSKTKLRKREQQLEDAGWIRLTEDMWKEQGTIVPKPKLLADANFPAPLVEKLRKEGIDTKTAQELGLHRLSDPDLLGKAGQIDCLLITMDDDFWSEQKFPLHKSDGLIFVDSAPSIFEESLGMDLLAEFLKSFGGGWANLKIRASADKVVLKVRSFNGSRVEYEMRAFRGKGVYAREIGGQLS